MSDIIQRLIIKLLDITIWIARFFGVRVTK